VTSEFPPPELPDHGGAGTPPPPPPAAPQPPVAPPPPPAPPAYGQQPVAYGQPGPAAYQMPRQSSSKATTAMVLGIVGLVVCQIVGIVAIVLGNQAKNEIDASGGQIEGRGMAVAGIVMGWIAVGLMVLGIGVFLLVAIVASSSSG
jgi:hypothetical protein